MWWKFFSFIVVLAARPIRRIGLVASASRVPAAVVGSAGLLAVVVGGVVPGASMPGPAASYETRSQTDLQPAKGTASLSPSPLASGTAYSTSANAEVEEIGTKLELLRQWYCFNCEGCIWGGHRLTGSDKEGVIGFHPEACTHGPCSQHPTCGITDEIAEASNGVLLAVVESLTAAAPAEIVALASAFPHVVRVNRDRRALQVIGCGDKIVASWSATSVPALREVLE